MPQSVEAVVPVYFFNQRFNDDLGVDAVGLNLPDLEAVRHRAIELAREIMSDGLLKGEVVLDRSIEVTDTGVIGEFSSTDATIPTGDSDPCFADL